MSVLLASLIDVTVVLALGLAVTAALRRKSAALRHAILATTIICALLMPALEALLPQLPVLHWTQPPAVESTSAFTGGTRAVAAESATPYAAPPAGVPWPTVLAGIWIAGMVTTFGGLLTGLVRLRRLRASCTPIDGPWRALADELAHQSQIDGPVALLQSRDRSLLVTCGLFRPAIILPAGSDNWTDDRQRIVLRHELAHVKRHDASIQIAGELLRVMQPFNPLVWIACRRLRQESEYACDDAVLESGVAATDYATHLFDVAAGLSGRQPVWASAPAIAHPSTLERRIVAMLHSEKNRQPLTRRGWTLAVALALAVSLPLAAVGVAPQVSALPGTAATAPAATAAPPAQSMDASLAAISTGEGRSSQETSLAGLIMDQSGGRLPGVTVTVTNLETQAAFVALTNAPGAFKFPALPVARYELEARLAGFRRLTQVVDLSSGNPADLALTLEIGALSEALTVRCGVASPSVLQFFFPTLSALEGQSAPVRIGGNIKEPTKIKDVKPTCPAGGVMGDVIVLLEGRIGEDGLIADIRQISNDDGTASSAEFYESAKAAVEEWEFTPTLLNRVPVDVTINVAVTFTGS